jgi:hypothetical protein
MFLKISPISPVRLLLEKSIDVNMDVAVGFQSLRRPPIPQPAKCTSTISFRVIQLGLCPRFNLLSKRSRLRRADAFSREGGMGLDNRFLERFMYQSFEILEKASGIVPWRKLSFNDKLLRELKRPSDEGIGPVSLFLARESSKTLEIFPSAGGMVPVNALLDRSRNVIFLNKPKNVGTGPERRLSFKSKNNKMLRFRIDAGMVPVKRFLARLSCI